MPFFRKKPIVVEAWQLPKYDDDAPEGLVDFLHSMDNEWEQSDKFGSIIIHTPEGDMGASEGDWIIKGIKGEFYPCKPDIFEATYQPTKEPDK